MTCALGYRSTPILRAASCGSSELSTVPTGVSTLTCFPSSVILVCFAIRYPMKLAATLPMMPNPISTATTIRMILTASFFLAGAEMPAIGGAPVIALPHLAQNFAPGSRLAPQELQKAMVHLRPLEWAEYIANTAIVSVNRLV